MEIDKENLKNETKETVSKVRDTLKNVDINKEAQEAKGVFKSMFVDPIGNVTKIATGEKEEFKKAVVLLIIEMVIALVLSLISAFKYSGNIFSKLWDLVLAGINPVVAILIPAIIVLIMNKNNKKSLTTVISTLVFANVPSLIASAFSLITAIFSKAYFIVSPIRTTLSAIAIVLTFVGMRNLFAEEKETFIKKFAIIELISAFLLYIIF